MGNPPTYSFSFSLRKLFVQRIYTALVPISDPGNCISTPVNCLLRESPLHRIHAPSIPIHNPLLHISVRVSFSCRRIGVPLLRQWAGANGQVPGTVWMSGRAGARSGDRRARPWKHYTGSSRKVRASQHDAESELSTVCGMYLRRSVDITMAVCMWLDHRHRPGSSGGGGCMQL